MAAKKLTPQQQRDRRAKIMLAVLGAVLLLIVAVELPGMLGGKKSSSPPVTTSSTDVTTSGAAPASLASAQVVAAPQTGQLSSFSRFARKDPFHALVSTTTSGPGSGPGSTTPSSSTPPAKAPPAGGSNPAAPTVTFAQSGTTAKALATGPMVLGAVMKLNGVRRVVAVGSLFPAGDPVFKLVAVGRKAIWISLIGGSFGDGHQTLKIELGHPIKLVNTTVKLNYLLRLVRMTMLPKPAAPASPTTTAATTSASTTSAATSTPAPTTTGTGN